MAYRTNAPGPLLPKHTDSPAEASITSSFKEDLYLAIQPSGGVMSAFANMDIKLPDPFPFVNFLWTGVF